MLFPISSNLISQGFGLLATISVLTASVSALQVTVGAGEVSLFHRADSCSDVQEFSCNDRQCDACAKPAGCHSEGNSHCLENTWCANAFHVMPDAHVGTPKHFRCVQTTGMNPLRDIILVVEPGEVGCYIDFDGVWATPGDNLLNAINATIGIDVGDASRCRQSGQFYGDVAAPHQGYWSPNSGH